MDTEKQLELLYGDSIPSGVIEEGGSGLVLCV
jgi:hypothetical protein